ncbi:hypothetical protein B0T10DRAFT_576925 [Thelonectria olida]|uniref:Uncharacterized protein n=1 Tax=Thelonectria olida TaxID=1576542 RepID=A0A9P8VZ64_9HYPO|nr:hypothetical protein B0T10DRAFT_576925 [Thelonectria olida]
MTGSRASSTTPTPTPNPSTRDEGSSSKMPAVAMPKYLSPATLHQTQGTSKLSLKSEQDCTDLLLKDFAALPEREIPNPSQETSQTRLPITSRDTSRSDGTMTNVWIGRTVRGAMADIVKKP